jgi:hypothetical protein
MPTCRVSGCEKPSDGYSPFCSSHKRRARRHGAAGQGTITATQLKPHREAIKRWLGGRPEANGWGPIRTLFGHVVEASRAELADMERKASPRYLRQAHDDIVKVASEGPETIDAAALTIAAMFALQQEQPVLFASDDGFRVQLARRFRTLSDINVAESWSQTDGKVKRVYRDASSRRLVTLGQLLSRGLGGLSLTIHKTMTEEGDRKAKERREAFDAIKADVSSS